MNLVKAASGRALLALVLVYLALPVLVVVIFSVQEANRTGLPFEGPSLRWFDLVLNEEEFRDALLATVRVAAGAALTATAIAFLGALATARGKVPMPGLIRGAGLLPLIVPPVFIGFAMLIAIDQFNITPSLFTVYLAHTLVTLPLAWAVMLARFDGFDFSVEEAARDLGASRIKVLTRVTLPMTWRSLAGAALISFAFSVDEFVVTNFVIGNENTLPVLIFSRLRREIDPSINAIATLLLLTAILAGVLAWLVMRGDKDGGPDFDDEQNGTVEVTSGKERAVV